MTSGDKPFAKQFCDFFKDKDYSNPMEESKKEIERLVPLAVAVMRTILDDSSASLEQKFKAAKTVLDLSGFCSPCSTESDSVQGIFAEFSLDQIADLKITADKILKRFERKRSAE